MSEIRFVDVAMRYPTRRGQVRALEQISLTVPDGQFLVVVGLSGSGKSTLLRCINRLIEPTSGRIWLDDRDTATVKPAQLRRGMGYVIQHAGLFPHRTVVDNIATVPRLLGWDKAEIIRGITAGLGANNLTVTSGMVIGAGDNNTISGTGALVLGSPTTDFAPVRSHRRWPMYRWATTRCSPPTWAARASTSA